MRTARAVLLAALSFSVGMQATTTQAATTAGSKAPGFALEGRSGPVELAKYRGKFVYLDFWASWCTTCKRSFPFMGELQQRYGPAGLEVVAINVDVKRADAERFLAHTPAAFTVAWDPSGAIAALYAIKGMPSSVLIDREGMVVDVHTGFNQDSAATIEAQIKRALGK